jgi:hypothetical protein
VKTLRDEFAMAALTGTMALPTDHWANARTLEDVRKVDLDIARRIYEIADAMLETRGPQELEPSETDPSEVGGPISTCGYCEYDEVEQCDSCKGSDAKLRRACSNGKPVVDHHPMRCGPGCDAAAGS